MSGRRKPIPPVNKGGEGHDRGSNRGKERNRPHGRSGNGGEHGAGLEARVRTLSHKHLHGEVPHGVRELVRPRRSPPSGGLSRGHRCAPTTPKEERRS